MRGYVCCMEKHETSLEQQLVSLDRLHCDWFRLCVGQTIYSTEMAVGKVWALGPEIP